MKSFCHWSMVTGHWSLRFLTVLLLSTPATAHYHPMIDLGVPTPPPTVDPGPDAALLRVTIRDAQSRELTSATVSVNDGDFEPDHDPYASFALRNSSNRHKGPIRFRNIPYYFYTDGEFEVRVPPGQAKILAAKGYEYQPKTVTVHIDDRDTVDVDISIDRAIDMASRGWYSGDTHVHMSRTGNNDDSLLAITSAKDILYTFLLSMNTDGYDRGEGKYESYYQRKGLGDRTVARRGPYHITSGQEYRVDQLGHVTIVLPNEYVPAEGNTDDVEQGPSLAVIADQVHQRRGFIGPAHGGYHNQEVDGLLLESKMDFLELLQFGGYRSLGLDGWYDFLNVGLRLPIVGASDYPPTRELSSEMTYAWSEETPTSRSWMEAVAAGRSFSTSGPLLFLTVDGHRPGALITQPDSASIYAVEISIESPIYPVRHVEMIVNVRIVERAFDADGRSTWQLQTSVAIYETSWIAARTYADAGTDAHTNPVFIYVGGKPRFSADSARNIIARLDGSIATIDLPTVVSKLNRVRSELLKMIASKPTNLPLPDLPK